MFEYTDSDLINIAETELNIHYESNLIDIYKLFFQAFFAQGHFITDKRKVNEYILVELNHNGKKYLPYFQDISNGKGLFRVSISVVNDNLINLNDYITLFLSNINHSGISWDIWRDKWLGIQKIILSKWPSIYDLDCIKVITESIHNHLILSHSECFKLTYYPRYRVMALSENDVSKYCLRNYL